jgi:hypothetical protein
MLINKRKYFLFIIISVIVSMTHAFAETTDQPSEPIQPSQETVSQSVYNEKQATTTQDISITPQEQVYTGLFPQNTSIGGFVIETNHLAGALSAVQSVNATISSESVNLASANFSSLTMNGLTLYKNFQVNGQPFVLRIKTLNNNDVVDLSSGNLQLSEFYAGTLTIPTEKGDFIPISHVLRQQPDLAPALTPFTQAPIDADEAKINVHTLKTGHLRISHFEMRIEPGQQSSIIH